MKMFYVPFLWQPFSFREQALRVGRIASPLNIGQCLVFLLKESFDGSSGLIRRTWIWYNGPFLLLNIFT